MLSSSSSKPRFWHQLIMKPSFSSGRFYINCPEFLMYITTAIKADLERESKHQDIVPTLVMLTVSQIADIVIQYALFIPRLSTSTQTVGTHLNMYIYYFKIPMYHDLNTQRSRPGLHTESLCHVGTDFVGNITCFLKVPLISRHIVAFTQDIFWHYIMNWRIFRSGRFVMVKAWNLRPSCCEFEFHIKRL